MGRETVVTKSGGLFIKGEEPEEIIEPETEEESLEEEDKDDVDES